MAAIPRELLARGVGWGDQTETFCDPTPQYLHSTPFLLCMCEPGNNIGEAGAKALAPCLKGLTQLMELNLRSEWVIGCVVTVDRICSDTWPLSPRVIGTGCGLT